MPNHKSAEKRMRQNEKKRNINRMNRGRMRTQIKKLRAELTNKNPETNLTDLLSKTASVIDKAVQKGVIHRNTAARYKSRLAHHVAKAVAPAA